MNNTGGVIRDVSDTAIWVAVFRARETEKPDGIFRDPYARMLAGERGEQIAATMSKHNKRQWAYTIRTYLFDAIVQERVDAGADLVVNLAAGLDSRPYRMNLPSSLRWVEVDLPGILEYKTAALRNEKPKCRLETVALDLSDVAARGALFDRLARESKQALIISEGLLVYLGAENVASLADDLSAHRSFRWWTFDLASPGLLKMMKRELDGKLDQANAPLKFAPEEGPEFFEAHGWRVTDVRSYLKWAAKKVKGLPLVMRFFSIFPEKKRPGNQPWSAAVVVENAR